MPLELRLGIVLQLERLIRPLEAFVDLALVLPLEQDRLQVAVGLGVRELGVRGGPGSRSRVRTRATLAQAAGH